MNSASGRGDGSRGGRHPVYRGGGTGHGRGRGMGGSGRGRGRGSGDHYDSSTDHSEGPHSGPPSSRNTHSAMSGRGGGGAGDNTHQSTKPGHLIPVKPPWPTPSTSIAWRVLYVAPPNSRPEVGPSGEKIPGPFSPPLRPSTPDLAANTGPPKPQDVLRKQNEVYAKKLRVQQLLQQAASSPSGELGTYVGRLSNHNNPLIPVLPRLDP
ncbi:hypothetical protein GGI20_003419 [Coemansia sp. BCRC 34301]|nr:hypothetical protein GGI20_003419 [Coemansia sp. BCRC 34301]